MEEPKLYYYYLGEVYVEYEEKIPKSGDRVMWEKIYKSQEVSGMVEFLANKTPVEAYNAIVELNKYAFIEKLELTDTENKRNPEYRMVISKLEKQ